MLRRRRTRHRRNQGHNKVAAPWIVSGLLPSYLRIGSEISECDTSSSNTTADSTLKKAHRYTSPATLGVTIVPSGSTTTKNGFTGLDAAGCSALSSSMEKSSLVIPERVNPPNPMRFRIREMATRMAATITDKKIKTIFYKFVRLTAQIGCITDCRLTRWPIFISLDLRRMSSDDQDKLL
jgi:hypothetical protein